MLSYEIIKHLYNSNIKNFVVENDFLGLFDKIPENDINKVSITDIRSAAFYALGLSQKNDCPIAMIIHREYLANTLTALTEAWFQRRCVIVIALGSNILNDTLDCYKNCTCGQYKVQTLADFEFCFGSMNKELPSVFLAEEKLEPVVLSYSVDITVLNKFSSYHKLFVYSPLASTKIDNITYIEPEFKYGMLSKFLGHCISGKEKCVLLTDLSVLKLEQNIFNSRYLDNRFNLIVTGEKPSVNIWQWLQSNNIKTVFCDSVKKAASEISESNKATVVFVVTKEGETICTQAL